MNPAICLFAISITLWVQVQSYDHKGSRKVPAEKLMILEHYIEHLLHPQGGRVSDGGRSLQRMKPKQDQLINGRRVQEERMPWTLGHPRESDGSQEVKVPSRPNSLAWLTSDHASYGHREDNQELQGYEGSDDYIPVYDIFEKGSEFDASRRHEESAEYDFSINSIDWDSVGYDINVEEVCQTKRKWILVNQTRNHWGQNVTVLDRLESGEDQYTQIYECTSECSRCKGVNGNSHCKMRTSYIPMYHIVQGESQVTHGPVEVFTHCVCEISRARMCFPRYHNGHMTKGLLYSWKDK